MPSMNLFSITNRKGKHIGLRFAMGERTKEELIAFLLKEEKEGLVVFVSEMSFVRLDKKWLPLVSADRSYLNTPKDFMGVLEKGKLRFSASWGESRLRSLWYLLKWKWHRGVGFFEQPTMTKCFEGKYKKYDPLGLG